MRQTKKSLLASEWFLVIGCIIALVVIGIFVKLHVVSQMESTTVIREEVAYEFPNLFIKQFLEYPLNKEHQQSLGSGEAGNLSVKDIFWYHPDDRESLIGHYGERYINATYESVRDGSTVTMHTYFQEFVGHELRYQKDDLLIILTDISQPRLNSGQVPEVDDMQVVSGSMEETVGSHNARYILPQKNGRFTVIYFLRGKDHPALGQSVYTISGDAT
jgi:hypothetical protein